VACGAKGGEAEKPKEKAEPKEVRPKVAEDPLEQCRKTVALIDGAVACEPRLVAAFKSSRKQMEEWGKPESFSAFEEFVRVYEHRKVGAWCAHFVIGVANDPPATTCTVVDEAAKRDAAAYLEAYYAAREPVVTGDDADENQALQELATFRDEMCACADRACTDAVYERMQNEPRKLANTRRAAGLMHDLMKCSNELRFVRAMKEKP
jgi:hypothetical protein